VRKRKLQRKEGKRKKIFSMAMLAEKKSDREKVIRKWDSRVHPRKSRKGEFKNTITFGGL